jgi:hypothetical protein
VKLICSKRKRKQEKEKAREEQKCRRHLPHRAEDIGLVRERGRSAEGTCSIELRLWA